MTNIEIFLTAFSLALDATAVALVAGTLHRILLPQAFKIAFFFGFFQLAMPFLGWGLGLGFNEYVESYGHIIGFVLLFGVGVKMLYETFKKESEEEIEHERHITETKVLTVMAVATSIDALVVGITFNFVPVNIILAVSVIGVITFVLAFLAVFAGRMFKHVAGNRIEMVGAIILIGLAFKILMGW